MSVEESRFEGGELYAPLVNRAYKLITRMTAKWGVRCDIYHCQNDLSTLDMYGINTDELVYLNTPDLSDEKLVLPAIWENYGMNDFNTDSHSAEEVEDSIYTLPDLVIPILSKVVVKEDNTNRVYIIRKTLLEHYNQAELYLQYIIDIMPSDDADKQVAELEEKYADKSIYNKPEDETDYLPEGTTISKIGR